MDILSVDLNNINLDDVNFDEDDRETIINVRLLAWRNKFKQDKASNKELDKELILAAWHPKQWRDWFVAKKGSIKLLVLFHSK